MKSVVYHRKRKSGESEFFYISTVWLHHLLVRKPELSREQDIEESARVLGASSKDSTGRARAIGARAQREHCPNASGIRTMSSDARESKMTRLEPGSPSEPILRRDNFRRRTDSWMHLSVSCLQAFQQSNSEMPAACFRRVSKFFKNHLDFIRQPVIMQICGCSSSVEYKLPKLGRWVRFPSAALKEYLFLVLLFLSDRKSFRISCRIQHFCGGVCSYSFCGCFLTFYAGLSRGTELGTAAESAYVP